MRRDSSRVWLIVLLGTSVLLTSGGSFAEKPKAPIKVSAWQKGQKLASTQRETYRLCAGTSITVAADAVAEARSKIPLPTSIAGLESFAYSAQLSSGRIDVSVDTKQKPAAGVLINGPRRTSILARGGHLAVIAGPSGVTVGLYDGKEASIGIGSTWKHITGGHMLTISDETPQGVESKLPVTPGHVVVDRPVLALDGGAETARATWDPVPGAKRYLLELLDTQTKSLKKLETTEPQIALRGLAPGRYELRVSAAEAMGLDGPASTPVYVNVVGVELPPGAFASQGKVYLDALQQLTLSHVDGLEATYDKVPVYFKAASRAGLRGTRATTLYLRLPGATERAALDLLPRDLHTEVAITPALARWPRDKVSVKFLLPKMLSQTSKIELIPSVTVNNQPVELEWARTDDCLETVIPTPPNYPGPWVLRAEVADQHGNVLGRNFLEIASTVGVEDEDIPREIHRVPAQARAKR